MLRYFNQLDSFRFVAALLVIIYHWLHFVPAVEAFPLGRFGVDFFFVISGFLISLKLFELKESIEQRKLTTKLAFFKFFVGRAFRIFPLYYVVLIFATAFNPGEIRDSFLWNLTYTTNFHQIGLQAWVGITHFWSLSVEEHFYLIYPLIILLISRRRVFLSMCVIAVLAILFRSHEILTNHDTMSAYVHTISCMDLFMYGGMLAYFYRYYESKFRQFFSLFIMRFEIVVTLLILFIALSTRWQSEWFEWVVQRAIIGILFAAIVASSVVGIKGIIGKILSHRILIRGGQMSYAIYLIHNFIPGILMPIKKLQLHFLVEFFIYLIITIFISYLLSRFIEIPLRKLSKKIIRPSKNIQDGRIEVS